ncbi:hypothetical protein C5E11_04040 [Clavibacter michiganensis]|nr:hypothetical protein C5E11_04040 [Clavibacter michiganensis]
MVDATRPAILPYRWLAHRKEVCVVIQHGQIRFIARDILEAIDQPLGAFDHQPDRHQPYAQRAAYCVSWDRDQVNTALSALHDVPLVQEFHRWLDQVTNLINSYLRPQLEASKSEAPVQRVVIAPDGVAVTPAGPTTSVPGSLSVADSAVVLSRDPAISLRTKDLHALLLEYGWVRKPAGEYLPADDMITLGYLAVVLRKIPNQFTPYKQVCITPEGLQEIHKRLGGTAAIDLTITDPTLQEKP